MTEHAPDFIAEMKAVLTEEKHKIQQELSVISHEQDGERVANFPEYDRDEEVNATESADFQATESTTLTLRERLKEVEKALMSIEAGSYGKTAEGELIPVERLRANPAATTIIKR